MSSTLEVKLRTQAAATPALTALLGSAPFRWYDTRLDQAATFPAVTVLLVAGSEDYSVSERLQTNWQRVQITVWDVDPESARAVEAAIVAFMDTFSADGIAGSSRPNYCVLRRQMLFTETEPPVFQRINDFRIFQNEGV